MPGTLINAVVVSISDSRHEDDDVSGMILLDLLISLNAEVHEKIIVTDDIDEIKEVLTDLCGRPEVNLIITTGGTGLSPRDNTPEATKAIIEKEVPGLSEAMRRETATATPLAMMSRGVCGIVGKILIINLPGSPKAVSECFEVIRPVLPHAIDLLSGKKGHE